MSSCSRGKIRWNDISPDFPSHTGVQYSYRTQCHCTVQYSTVHFSILESRTPEVFDKSQFLLMAFIMFSGPQYCQFCRAYCIALNWIIPWLFPRLFIHWIAFLSGEYCKCNVTCNYKARKNRFSQFFSNLITISYLSWKRIFPVVAVVVNITKRAALIVQHTAHFSSCGENKSAAFCERQRFALWKERRCMGTPCCTVLNCTSHDMTRLERAKREDRVRRLHDCYFFVLCTAQYYIRISRAGQVNCCYIQNFLLIL